MRRQVSKLDVAGWFHGFCFLDPPRDESGILQQGWGGGMCD